MPPSQRTGVVRIERPGPPDVLKYVTVTLSPPGPGEVLIRQESIGVNFLDVFYRNGTFPAASYPAPVGSEASGTVESVGAGVSSLVVGDRVAYHLSQGAYAEMRLLKAETLFKLPDDISFDQAASVLVKGLTAHMLVKGSHPLKAGEVALIHAMTGGVGTLLSAWARSLGATVIGTVGSAAKKELALGQGFQHVVDLQSEDFADTVRTVTEGRGIDVVYDSVGGTTFQKSTALVREGGSSVSYGWASGLPVVDATLIEERKIHYAKPALLRYLPDRKDLEAAVSEIFALVRAGVLAVQSPIIHRLADAATTHADLESRKTTGSILLRP